MAKNSKRENDRGWGAGRVAFMAHRAAILSELAEGWPVTVVYAAFKDRLGIGYRQFSRYVAAARKHEEPGREATRQTPSRRVLPSRPRPLAGAAEQPGRGFHFDPAAIGNKDLI